MKKGKKLLALLLSLCLLLTLLPFSALATEMPDPETEIQLPDVEAIEPETEAEAQALDGEPQPPEKFTVEEIPVRVNPLYEGLIDPDSIHQPERIQRIPGEVYFPSATFTTEQKAGEQVRSYLKSRTETFTVYVKSESSDYNQIIENLLNIAFAHTGKPTEGDYLMWHWESYGGEIGWNYKNGYYEYELTFYFTYYTTAAQEKEVDTAVSNLLRTLNVTYKSDYQKVCAVYDYICDNVTYDYAHLEDTSYTRMFTAYAALIDKTAVCQGYALLFYRLMLELGVDTRLIAGEGLGVPHAWNIVKLGNVYYNVDSTWDAGMDEYSFFLRNTLNFPGHVRYLDYMSYEFHTEYPMSETDYVDGVAGVPETYYVRGYCGDNAYWALDREGTVRISGEGNTYDYPDSGELAKLSPWTFWMNDIKKLIVEEGITYLGKHTFSYMETLTSIKLPSTLREIGEYSFAECTGLTSVEFPNGLTTIGSYAFQECTGLTGIRIPDSVTNIGFYAFSDNTGLTEVKLSANLKELSGGVFSRCSALTEIDIPDGVTVIGPSALRECESLRNVKLPSSLSAIHTSAFNGCISLPEIVFPDGIQEIQFDSFAKCESLTTVTIPSSVTKLSGFWYCSNLETVNLNNSGVITQYAFKGCPNLRNVNLNGDITKIEEGAFEDCDALEKVTIPASVTSLCGFAGCDNLRTIVLNNSGVIESKAFADCANLQNFKFYGEITEIKSNAFLNCDSLTEIHIPETLKHLTGFTDCDGLTELILPDNITSVSGFGDCDNLATVDLNKCTFIGGYAFNNCDKITHIEFPETLTGFGGASFQYCDGLVELTFPNVKLHVGDFYGCSNLETVYLNNIGEIQAYAFGMCPKLENVYIGDDVTAIGSCAFTNCYALKELIISAGVKRLDDHCFRSCEALSNVVFCGDAPSINRYAFDSMTFTAYYPAGNATWTEDVLQNYGGNITWVPLGPEVKFVGASLSLKGDIGLNFYAELSEKLLADTGAYMKFTGSGAARYMAVADGVLDESDGSYRYSVALNAKNMGDDVTAQVYNATGAVGDSSTLSIKYYADYVINNSNKEVFVNLMKAMLNYGAAAQTEFGYDTENLVNADMTEADRTLPEKLDVAKYAHTWSGEEDGIEVTNASLLLQSETKIRIYFKLAEGKTLGDFTFTIDDVEVIPVQSGDEYYIEKTNVAAKDLDTMYTFCLGNRQLTYCGLSYVNQVLSYSSDADLLNLVKSLYAYNKAANAYFQPDEVEPPHVHTYAETVTEPTCTEDGYTTHTCTFCGDSYTDTEVPTLGHSYESVVTAPTCDKDGYTTHTCSVCGDSYTDSETDALDHDWGEWTVTLEPTVDTEGEETRTCQREGCDETETRTIPVKTAETLDVEELIAYGNSYAASLGFTITTEELHGYLPATSYTFTTMAEAKDRVAGTVSSLYENLMAADGTIEGCRVSVSVVDCGDGTFKTTVYYG